MGKRKERRHAALSNTGRRMKLDLFAEPSGDLGGSDVHDKVHRDQKDAIELPNSPSSSGWLWSREQSYEIRSGPATVVVLNEYLVPHCYCPILQLQRILGFLLERNNSGQQTQNPLLLLGQYSDDELGDELDERENQPAVECSSGNDAKVEGLADGGCEDVNNKTVEEVVSAVDQPKTDSDSCLPDVKHQQVIDCATKTESLGLGKLQKQMDFSTCVSVVVSSEVTGDATSRWKMVLHEESNQYYYWNMETGETSWTVPDVLFGTDSAKYDQKDSVTGYSSSEPVGTYVSSSVTCNELGSSLAAQYSIVQSTVDGNEIKTVNEGNHVECQKNLHEVNALQGQEGFVAPGSSSNDAPGDSYDKADNDLPVRVMGQSERLLEKLRSLKGSQGSIQNHDWILRHMLEVEVRHSDIEALISHGSSLLPFWSHSEVQLKRLEDVVNDEIYQLARSAVIDEVAATEMSSLREDKSLENTGNGTEVDMSGGKSILSNEDPCSIDGAADSNVESLSGHPGNDVTTEINPAVHNEIVPKPSSPVVEDVDMDVDMEVEDSSIDIAASNVSDFKSFGQAEQASVSGFNSFGQEEQARVSGFKSFDLIDHSNLHMETSSIAPNNASALPPAPGEEIPPPPPDSEGVPPPPPDADREEIPPPPPDDYGVPPPPTEELQQHCYPTPVSSYSDLSVPYASQYNLAYPDSNYQYHANIIAAAPDGQFYGHVDGSQVSLPHASLYYGTAPGACSQSAPLAIASVDAYYNVKEGTVPPLPVYNNLDSSQFVTESGSVGYGAIHMGSFDVPAVVNPGIKVDVAPDSGVTENPSSILPSSSDTQVSSTVPAQSSDVVLAAAVATSSVKGQSKVARTKKRTLAVAPTLRSNKKVSSLVDKWKAAKEEMNESEEDEPESAYDFLERKRRKEIEEWHARQIASGEAKENANFQPLGGDWREKVKRKRGKAAREAATEAKKEEKKQQPDVAVAQISKDLPLGWQAYWDESTKKVYYGNTITSETSWTRPSK